MIQSYKYSDKGPRSDNEDSIKMTENSDFVTACLADGVGGERCGKLASETVVNLFVKNVTSVFTDLLIIVEEIHNQIKILQIKNKECLGMATTLTGCVLNEHILKGIHVGDSRLCVLRGNGLKQLTDNHTEVQRLFKGGKIKYGDIDTYPRKHVLESAIGIKGHLTIQKFEFDLLKGDRIVITSDGVHDIISKVEFRNLSKRYARLNSFGDGIVDLLKLKKVKDNISFVLLELL